MEGGKPYDVVFLCSVSIPAGYRLVGNAKYPGIASDYARSFALLRSLPCDVFLGAHGSYYGLTDKIARMRRPEAGNPFIDPQGYRDFLTGSEQAFERELAEQQSKTKH
jgi:metallo-beta-lactamase class B